MIFHIGLFMRFTKNDTLKPLIKAFTINDF